MLAVTVEVWPGGDVRQRKVIHTISLENVSGLAEVSDYKGYVDGVPVEVEGHARDHGALVLTLLALQDYLEHLPEDT